MKLADFLSSGDEVKTVVVVKAEHLNTLITVHQALEKGIAHFILIGDLEHIKRIADEHDLDVTASDIIDEGDEHKAAKIAARLAAHQNAQVVMKGNVHTSVFTRALLDKTYGLNSQGNLISHAALFALKKYHKPLIITDGALNIAPDLEKKKGILMNALAVARSLGIDAPKVACIAPVEKVNDKLESTVHARKLVLIQQHEHIFGNAVIEGPLAFDAAMSHSAAEGKGIEGVVPGDADILLFPCLDSANAVYKTLSLFGEADHAGILAGLSVPAVLTSRSDTSEVRMNSLRFALAASR